MSPSGFSTQQELDLYYLARNIIWRYRLDDAEAVLIKDIRRILSDLRHGLERAALRYKPEQFTAQRIEAALNDITVYSRALDMAGKPQELVMRDIAEASGLAAAHSMQEQYDILSVGSASRAVRQAGAVMTATDFGALFLNNPLGGRTLQSWVDTAFGVGQAVIQEAVNEGMFLGEGYPGIVRRVLRQAEDITLREATTLARTYVQSAAVSAQEAVYAANEDILWGVEWSAVMEPGYKKTGRGTCPVCAALDGQKWKTGEQHPPCPKHAACRCLLLPVVDWEKIGIPAPELEAVARPFTIRPDQNIGTGGKRAIEEVGFHQGNWGTWASGRDAQFKINAIGPERYRLWQESGLPFDKFVHGMVDSRTGELHTVKELRARLGGEGASYIRFSPARDIAEASGQARLIGVKADYGSLPLETARDINASLAEAKTRGLHVPGRVEFSADTFRNALDASAAYLQASDRLVLNPKYDYASLAAETELAYESRIWSTGSSQHVFRHEIGHAIAADNAPERYAKLAEKSYRDGLPLRGAVADMVKKEISVYAAVGPLELVAEVYAGLMDGKSYSSKIMTLYRAYGGVWK